MTCSWRKIQKENFNCLETLSAYLKLNCDQQKLLKLNAPFGLNLPKRLAEKIKKGTLDDPILRQFVPLKAEEEINTKFVKDPVGDCQAACAPKCLQKYAGRALLLTTSACAMHCRFCFRQNYPYAQQSGFLQELNVIREDCTLKEVILSGGDPLSMGNAQLKELLFSLAAIEHVKRIRFHSRFPIGIPERIDEDFLALLEEVQTQVWFVIHCNHPDELDSDVLTALKKIQKLGIPVLNQWVLLKKVNDSIDILQTLCEKLIDQGIFPYYLHQLDRVQGASHFEVSQEVGKTLIRELNQRLAGYGVPKYVQEIPTEKSKTPIL